VFYVITLIGGIVLGSIMPRGKSIALAWLGIGILLLTGALSMALSFSYDHSAIINVMTLVGSSGQDRLGLLQVCVGGYTSLVGGIVLGIRTLLRDRET
jgi:hypothetical protein